jgi:REP-associated tyrosine transposase
MSLPHQIYHVTTTTERRTHFFTCCDAARAAAACFEVDASRGNARLMAWVLMPDHVHWLLQLGDQAGLAKVVNRLKAGSARAANKVLGRRGAVWCHAYHDHALRHDEDVQTTARYIIANPIRAGLVRHIGDYPFWNASWL